MNAIISKKIDVYSYYNKNDNIHKIEAQEIRLLTLKPVGL